MVGGRCTTGTRANYDDICFCIEANIVGHRELLTLMTPRGSTQPVTYSTHMQHERQKWQIRNEKTYCNDKHGREISKT